jgi:hypothetical protein
MPTPTPMIESLATARFKTVKAAEPIEVSVHFNPASLQYTVSNTLKDQGSGSKKKQYVSQTTAKLTMDLVFDTTATGVDVRETTDKMAKLLKPHGPSGMVEQYKETLDFFAASGVPLRSSVNLTLSSQDVIFESNKNPNASVDGNLAPEPVSVPTSPGPAGGPAGLANSLGDPRTARAIAAANGSASLRFSAGAELAVGVGAGVSLSAAAAFSTGASAGFGLGISGGAGLGISGGVGAGLSADFSGLRASASTEVSMPDPGTALTLTADAGAGGGTQFGLGGRAQATGSASLSADVGANAELTARLGFGGA